MATPQDTSDCSKPQRTTPNPALTPDDKKLLAFYALGLSITKMRSRGMSFQSRQKIAVKVKTAFGVTAPGMALILAIRGDYVDILAEVDTIEEVTAARQAFEDCEALLHRQPLTPSEQTVILRAAAIEKLDMSTHLKTKKSDLGEALVRRFGRDLPIGTLLAAAAHSRQLQKVAVSTHSEAER